MDRQLLPLLMASSKFVDPDESEALDRLRMQKGVFLLENRGPTEWRSLYEFEPYDWGPFSRSLIQDVNQMVVNGQMMTVRFEGFRFWEYQNTEQGELLVEDAVANLEESTVEFVRRIRNYVTHRSFSQLLKEVYAAYPDYAVRSRFTG
jgi:uncharacterized protein YwgA